MNQETNSSKLRHSQDRHHVLLCAAPCKNRLSCPLLCMLRPGFPGHAAFKAFDVQLLGKKSATEVVFGKVNTSAWKSKHEPMCCAFSPRYKDESLYQGTKPIMEIQKEKYIQSRRFHRLSTLVKALRP